MGRLAELLDRLTDGVGDLFGVRRRNRHARPECRRPVRPRRDAAAALAERTLEQQELPEEHLPFLVRDLELTQPRPDGLELGAHVGGGARVACAPDRTQAVLELVGLLVPGQVRGREDHVLGDDRPRTRGGRLAPADDQIGRMQHDLEVLRSQRGDPIGDETGHRAAREQRQHLRRRAQQPAGAAAGGLEASFGERGANALDDGLVVARLDDDGHVLGRPALRQRADLEDRREHRHHRQGERETDGVRIAFENRGGDGGRAARPLGLVQHEDRDGADHRGNHDHGGQHRQPDPRLVDPLRQRDEAQQKGRHRGERHAREDDEPDHRAERDEGHVDLAILRDAAEEQDRGPRKRGVQQLPRRAGQHRDQRLDDGHGRGSTSPASASTADSPRGSPRPPSCTPPASSCRTRRRRRGDRRRSRC